MPTAISHRLIQSQPGWCHGVANAYFGQSVRNTGCVNIRQASSESVWAWINITGFDSGLVPRIRFRYSLQGIRAKFDAGVTETPREFVNRYAVSEVQVESAASVRLLWREFVNAIQGKARISALERASCYGVFNSTQINRLKKDPYASKRAHSLDRSNCVYSPFEGGYTTVKS